ncbi:site-specific integrase [Allohahella marinimesophila]|uniref:Site-specific integrase n=1 Tax=Allohahella marinimesophila TaxID=1054972 RepID=A0ABP7PW17_9GAMM
MENDVKPLLPAPSQTVNEGDEILARAKGYSFRLYDKVWVLDKNTSVYLRKIRDYISGDLLHGFLKTLSFYAANLSAGHTSELADGLLHFFKTTGADAICEIALINYRASLTTETEWRLGRCRTLLRQWHRLGYPGVTDEVIELLDQWRLKGSLKGEVVKRMDPVQGPLTDIELQGFNEAVVRAFELDQITLTELAMCLVISNTGRRPVQVSHLRVCDVVSGKNLKGEPFYGMNIPRAKQRTGFRASFKFCAVTQDLFAVVKAQAKSVILEAEHCLGFELQEADRQQIPLFPDLKAMSEVETPVGFREFTHTDKLHSRSAEFTETIQAVANRLGVHSERTGEELNISSRRFRYTTGTRAAREGFGELVIAELLDHTDTQNSGVYIKNIPEHAERLDEAVGFQLAPYAQAFAGVLVDSEKSAKRGGDATSRIRTEEGQGIGTCGEHGFCGANVPIPCYTCMHFQPWLDGPHPEVYQKLLAERERIKEITGDLQVAAILDRSIIAVADVITRCEKRREELKKRQEVTTDA